MRRFVFVFALLVTTSSVAWPPRSPKDEPPSLPPQSSPDVAVDPCPLVCDFSTGDEGLPDARCAPSYNMPAGVELRGRNGAVNYFGSVSYLYWYLNQEGMQIATTLNQDAFGGFHTPSHGRAITQPFHYTSGFRVALGLNFPSDDWVCQFQYTYLRPHSRTQDSLPLSSTSFFNFRGWFSQEFIGPGPAALRYLSRWHLGLDFLDWAIERSFYQARRLVVTPFGGLRAAWIRQSLDLRITDIYNPFIGEIFDGSGDDLEDGPYYSKNRSYSWGLGPRAGVNGKMLFDYGLRASGGIGGSLLFTQYTTVSHREVDISTPRLGYHPHFALHYYNCLRPMVEANLGVGFGTYFCRMRYHFDLSATYDFNYLWSQNMIRYLNDLFIVGITASPNALYFHGLTINGRFDF